MTIRLTTAATAIALLIGASGALGNDKPTDPQIAHIAYTAGLLDIEAAKQAIATSRAEPDLIESFWLCKSVLV